ncbi:MAG: hypothetical protein J5787_00035 [Alphaproteobacteria bacterium]|nr:hypothetical protein [Alphaproteobacteria bacterium]
MMSSPFDIFGVFDRIREIVAPFASGYIGPLSGIIVLALLVRMGAKLFGGGLFQGASSVVASAPAPASSENTADAQGNAGGGAGNAEQEKQNDEKQNAEKLKEEELRRAQEQLHELFEMFDEKEYPVPKTHEEKELEELGLKREDLEQLKEKYKELTLEISSLLEKGLNEEQTAKSLISRTTEQVPLMELQPLIEAMTLFLQKNENAQKNGAVIGMDPQFEQKAALSALKRGEYETALGYLERQAVETMNRASSSHRSDVCRPALEQAASLYRAIGVLTRPLDPERSFEALIKSKELDPENTQTQALIARAYYESGKTKKAENLFENIAENAHSAEYVSQYATQMTSQIRAQRTMQHAQRIREDYEHLLGDAEGRQKTDQRVSLQQKKREEVRRANTRFIVDGLRERDNEHELV